jgi:hypothetical protein
MALIRSVMLVAGVLAVLLLGVGTAVAAAPDHAPPPCHGSAASDHAEQDQSGTAGPEMKGVACCVACVAAALPTAPPAPAVDPGLWIDGGVLPGPLTGLSPGPDPHPPRDVAI